MKWYINIGQRFNWNDIDEKALDEHVEVEYKKFLGNKWDPRSPELIKYNTKCGLAAEYYLVQHHGYKRHGKKYEDVHNKENIHVEVKSKSVNGNVKEEIKKELEKLRYRKLKGKHIAEHVIFFTRDKEEYECNSFWSWNEISKEYECQDNINVQLDAFMV